jgi:hypothetical protein
LERHPVIAGLAPSFPQTPGASEQDAGSFVVRVIGDADGAFAGETRD